LKSLTLPAFAKINLGLRILRKRTDGFHDLETVFMRIGWKDKLTFTASQTIEMTSSVKDLPTDEGNLCIRAAQSLAAAVLQPTGPHPTTRWEAAPLGVKIHLEKHIPHGAGLGGGSSDAATVLKACSDMWGVDVDLRPISASLGSDVPFFLHSPVAYGTGRGEVLSTLPFPKALQGTRLLVIVPDQRVATADAFSQVQPYSQRETDLKTLVSTGSLADWNRSLKNDFETSVFARFAIIRDLKQLLLDSGAAFAQMSGSGSAVFGVFDSPSLSQSALNAVRSTWPSYKFWEGPSNTEEN